ncbi:GNAT family N-acetyltransferase [bacterium]|nr:GNAT family N-acetyltransferase [bacterium]
MSEIIVRAAKSTDETAVLELVGAEMKAQADADPRFRLRPDAVNRYAVYLRNRMREIDSAVFVALVDGKVVGTATGSIRVQEAFFETRRFGYVSDLVVDASRRRAGIGSALWKRVQLWFRGLGVTVVRLHIAAKSAEANGFWGAQGAAPFLLESWIDLPEVPPADPSAAKDATAPEDEPTPAGRENA